MIEINKSFHSHTMLSEDLNCEMQWTNNHTGPESIETIDIFDSLTFELHSTRVELSHENVHFVLDANGS